MDGGEVPRTQLVRDLIERLHETGHLPHPPEEYDIEWGENTWQRDLDVDQEAVDELAAVLESRLLDDE